MGTKAHHSDEWIELYNNTDKDIDLSNWQMIFYPLGDKGKPRITTFKGLFKHTSPVIKGIDYFVLERTNDNPIKNIVADQIFKGGLKNQGGILELRDADNNLIDRVDCSNKWFAGNKDKRISMERINSSVSGDNPQNWASNNLISRNGLDADNNKINGTPGAENSVSKSQTKIKSLPFNEFNEITLTFLGSPYIVREAVLVVPQEKTLIIEPGVIIKFGPPRTNRMKVAGTLKAIGTESQPIVFTSGSGFWSGIRFVSTSIDSELNHVIIERAAGRVRRQRYVIKANQSSFVIKNSILKNNNRAHQGLRLINSSAVIDNLKFLGFNQSRNSAAVYINNHSKEKKLKVNITNSYFKDNSYGIKIKSGSGLIKGNYFENNNHPIKSSSSYFVFENNQGLNNNFNGILIEGLVSRDIIWKNNPGFPYILRNLYIAKQATLIIEPGVIIKFKTRAGATGRFNIRVSGTLLAIGKPEKPIVFTSIRDDLQDLKNRVGEILENYKTDTNNNIFSPYPGDWGRIVFLSSSNNSKLENVIVRYGGSGPGRTFVAGAIQVRDGAKVNIKDSIIENNRRGLELIFASAIVENTLFRNHYKRHRRQRGPSALYVLGKSNLNITNSHFENNYYGILINSRECPKMINITFGKGENSNVIDLYPQDLCPIF